MKTKLFMYLVLCCVLVFTLGLMAGCKGSDGTVGPTGATGATGAQGAQGPVGPQGPNGTFGNSTCTDCHHLSDQAANSLEPVRVSGLTTGGTGTPGTPFTVSVKSAFSAGTYTVNVLGYYWEFMDGIASTASKTVTISTLPVTLTPGTSYKAALIARALPDPALDRTMIVPINGLTQELAQNSEYMVWLFGDDGKIYYDIAKVKASDSNVNSYAPALNSGINNVPVNVPVLLNAKGAGPYNWIFVSQSGTATMSDANTKNAYFTPNAVGTYVVSPDGGTTSIKIYAGNWRGEITGVDMTTLTADGNGTIVPDGGCLSCHDGNTAPDKFTPWKSSGHATKFEEGINEGGHYGAGCFGCHTVGFNTSATNNGFDEQANYASFITDTNYFGAAVDDTRYSRMATSATYSALFKQTGIQCENCHGPQPVTAGGAPGSHMGVAGSPRVSLSSDVCGQCHGSPQHHGRFQEWQDSPTGHASYELAQGEGLASATSTTLNSGCAACHTAQGNLIYQQQLLAGNPLRTIPNNIPASIDTVQPQTCVVCHDPHAEGTTTDVVTDAQPRITGDTPMLPAGFDAKGVGKGAMCIICHNTRNGGYGSNVYLHEDNDPVFGATVSTTPGAYAAPHSPAQGDVLMGHNAYFLGGYSTSNRSPHASITDTCVNCHMVKSRPNAEYADYENTNHTFKASLEICGSCHGIDAGLGPKLQMDTQAALDQLLAALQAAIISQASGTYAGNIASATLTTSHGAPAVNLTFNDATPAANLVSLSTVAPLNTEAHRDLAKAIWNYNLIKNDSSLGVHNPEFIRNVIGVSFTKAQELQ